MRPSYQRCLIVGAGAGLSASLARLLAKERGMAVGLAARDIAKLADLATETGAKLGACDVARRADVERLFAAMDVALGGPPDVVVFNASARVRGAFVDLDPDAVERAVAIGALGGFHVAQAALRRMAPAGHGALLFTGASASVKGFPHSAPFAMGKFALRGLAQSLAREMQPKGIHVAHVVIDGGIRAAGRPEAAEAPDSLIDPDALARAYLALLDQDRSCWTSEIEVRPWVERF